MPALNKQKLLIANRGEIALRVISSAQSLGVPTLAVYTDADASAPHVVRATEAVLIPNYLDMLVPRCSVCAAELR